MDEPAGFNDTDELPTFALPRRSERVRRLAFALVVLEGQDRGARVIVDGTAPGPILVGCSTSCALRLTDRRASRRHASIDIDERGVRITDLHSANGTYVDGVLVLDAYLRGGEIVRIGESALRLDLVENPPAPPPAAEDRFGRLLGASLEMRRIYPLAQRLAAAPVPLIIEGETGTGKEVLAEAMHEASPRAAGPYVVFDCTVASPSLIESELFGHERGAFTGAVSTRRGVFEQAHGGTLLIDEIGDLAPELQAKLLRAIERSEIRRVGGDQRIQVDVRVLAATRRDLDHEVQEGRFRDDLFHRLAVARIEIPPLRRRRGDVTLLARHFWRALGAAEPSIPEDLLQRWEDYSWPGNVRELRNAVARQIAVGDLGRGEVPPSVPPPSAPPSSAEPAGDVIAEVLAEKLPLTVARLKVVQAFEQLYIDKVLADHDGNVVHAAAASGIARRYFQILRNRRRR